MGMVKSTNGHVWLPWEVTIQFRSMDEVYSHLMSLLKKRDWNKTCTHVATVSLHILLDLNDLVGYVVTTDGRCGVSSTKEDCQIAYALLKEKYKL